MSTITVTFDPPTPADSPSAFNTKAFATLGDLNTWSTQANTVAGEVNTNASTASTAATTATTQAGTATSAASTASSAASSATTSASTATTQASNASSSASAAAISESNAAASAAATAGAIVAERSATATLTSKTLTNPVINGFSGTGNGSVTGTLTSAGFNSSGSTGFVGTSGGSDLYFWDINQFAPNTNGTRALGTTSLRWSEVWCTAGAFNTSDARLKTPVSKFNKAEIQAAIALSKEIGWFQWLDSVQQKGPIKARHHVGLTVQRAEEVLASFGLDPWLYGFMSHDKWDDQITEHPAIEAKEAVLDEAGNVIEEAIEASEAWSEVTLKAGESYAFRYDQLNLFIARGIEARLVALEANA